MKYRNVKLFARKLRNNPTPSERILWEYLKGRQLGDRKFLRQHAIFYQHIKDESFCFIPDFFCYQESLAIELDGRIHDFQIEKDQKRDAILAQMGIKVLRIKNEELESIERVLMIIESCFENRRFRK